MTEEILTTHLEKINDDDPSERRAAIEELMFEDLDENTLKIISEKIVDSDRGVRNAASTLLISNENPVVPGFITSFVASSDIAVRNLAGEILIQYGSAAVPTLLEFLPKGNDDDKKFVIDVLGLIGDDKAGEDILKEIDNTENENVLLACQEALGNIKYLPAVKKLLEQYSLNELFKPTIIEALGKIGSQEALDFMVSVYNSEDDLTRFSLIESLGLIGDEKTFFFLLSQLNTVSGPIVWPIIAALYELKNKFNFDIPFDETMKNALLETVLDADDKYKVAAIHLVSAFNDKDLLLACLKIYGNNFELDEIVKQKFMENPKIILTNISSYLKANAANLNSLLELLQELLQFEQGPITDTLSILELRNLTDALADGIENPDEEIRRAAFEILYMLDVDMAVLFIDKVVEDDNIWNRLKLLELVVDNNCEEVNAALNKLAEDADEFVSERAKEILTQRNNPNIIS
jgi:HEAT repeat protein